MRNFNKARGLADWAFIAIIVGAMTLIGSVVPSITKQADSPIEQLAEKVIKMQTGQEVDFSAHLKKDEEGNVSATDLRANTTAVAPAAQNRVIITDGKVPVQFRK